MKHLLAVGFSLVFASAVAETPTPVYITNFSHTHAGRMSEASLHEERNRADEYARVSNLTVLQDGNHSEIRFWVSAATFDPSTNGIATFGYVLTDEDSRMCSIAYSGKSTVPKSGQCKHYSPQRERQRTLADLVQLSTFSDFSIDCDVLDGAWVLIDAVSNGKRFVLSANNPQNCSGDAAKLVSALLCGVDTQTPL